MIKRRRMPSPSNQPRAFIWASIFWQARQLIDARVEDKIIAAAWLATIGAASDGMTRPSQQPRRVTYPVIEEWFVRHLLSLAPSEDGQSLGDLFIQRGVLKTIER